MLHSTRFRLTNLFYPSGKYTHPESHERSTGQPERCGHDHTLETTFPETIVGAHWLHIHNVGPGRHKKEKYSIILIEYGQNITEVSK